ncbi:hypothetical protein TNCV_758461 [Trichonephila clavipes]|nr:hypothetical protein TNCV_758461 [Trichonephila clavipes]
MSLQDLTYMERTVEDPGTNPLASHISSEADLSTVPLEPWNANTSQPSGENKDENSSHQFTYLSQLCGTYVQFSWTKLMKLRRDFLSSLAVDSKIGVCVRPNAIVKSEVGSGI